MRPARAKHSLHLLEDPNPYKKLFYIESYGCQMNSADSEIVASILNKEGFGATRNYARS